MIPTDEEKREGTKKRRRLTWLITAGALLLLLVAGGVEAYRILYAPQNVFNIPTIKPGSLPTPGATPSQEEPGGGVSQRPSMPSDSPAVSEMPDITHNQEILNILLIGIDRNPQGGKSSGSDPHADVMMVVAIDFKEKKVDLISLPRDTFIHAPEIMNGVYKLNASFNVGGGFEAKNREGFLKVCEAAKYMLGGIPVEYYYAVDFKELVHLVNAIGGVDYYVESPEYVRDGVAGQRHLDGDNVLSYLRVRKTGPEQGDNNRVNRQKKMMVAIFEQIKKNGKLSMLPGLINAANSGVFTNTSLEQTLALASFARNVNPDHITMHSMVGELHLKAGWGYVFTDQKARVELIRQVYGFDVPEQARCSMGYADWLVDCGFSAIRYLKTGNQVLDWAEEHRQEFTGEQSKEYDALKAALGSAQAAYDMASLTLSAKDSKAMAAAQKELKAHALKLAKLTGCKELLKWTFSKNYWNDPAINEVKVDFR